MLYREARSFFFSVIGIVLGTCLALSVGMLYGSFPSDEPVDYTDSGVGCVNDCLDKE